MIIFLWIYVISIVVSGFCSIIEWKTEINPRSKTEDENHKGWTKGMIAASCFVPISNTSYSISALIAFFKFFNKKI